MSNHVSKNIFWLSISRAFALVFLFLAYAQLFRYLGPEEYGRYQFVLSFVMLFSTVVDFGIQQFVTKKIAENPSEKKKYFHSFLAFEFAVALILYAVLIGISFASGYEAKVFWAIALAGLGMVANAMCYPFLALLTAFQDLRRVALLNFLNSLVNIIIIFLAIALGKGIVFLAMIQLCFGALDLILYRIYIRRHVEQPAVLRGILGFNFGGIKEIIVAAWPFIFLVGFSAIYNRIDVVLISHMLGYEATGYYGAAYKIFDLLAFFPAVVSHSLFPHFTALMARAAVLEVRENLEKYLRLMVAVALPMAVGGMILARPLIVLIAGPEFAPAAGVLSILIWAPALLFIYIPVNSLVISQLTKKAAAITGLNVVINITGNLILLPIWGVKAGAVMTVLSETLQGIFYFYFVRKNITEFSFFSLALRPLLAAAVMAGVLWQVRDMHLAVSVSAGALIYVGMLLVIGFFKKEDIGFIRSIFKRNS